MYNIISETVGKLSEITEKANVDWVAFDSVLNGLDDINICDEENEETILSEFIMGVECGSGEILADAVRHFLSCGYDVTAHKGINGGLALSALCWSFSAWDILESAKLLMNAGAPVLYISKDDEPGEEAKGLFGSLGWQISGAWMVDNDFEWANILEAYYAMAEANIDGKDYNAIDHCFKCIGKSLTAVSAAKNKTASALQKEGAVSVYTEPLIMWFEDKPLVVSCYTDFVVNPIYVEDKKEYIMDATECFSEIVGAKLEKMQYIGETICCLDFSNGKRVMFASRSIGNRKRVGTFEIREAESSREIEKLKIDYFCGIDGVTFGESTTDYSENALALFCGSDTYLLFTKCETNGKNGFELFPCSKELPEEYRRQYPLEQPKKISCFYEQDVFSAVCVEYSEGFLYLKASECCEIDVQLSDDVYDPLEYTSLPWDSGKHIKFKSRR